jgi:GTPase SAR1 family protein
MVIHEHQQRVNQLNVSGNLPTAIIHLRYNNSQKYSHNPRMSLQKKGSEADYTVKIVIVGDSGVGKTNMLCRFCDN